MNIMKRIRKLLLGSYKLAVEDGMIVGKGVSIVGGANFGSEPYLITLGDYVRISMGVMFITHDGGTWAFRDLEEYKDVIKYGRIKIGAHSFIGAKAIIMPGVTIGERCVIGVGSVVTKDIPNGSVACGIPAKVIMTTDEYAQKCVNKMQLYDIVVYNKVKKKYLIHWLNN